MSGKTDKLFCKVCNKPLQDEPCINCKGKGYIRKLFVLKKECDICHGSGKVKQCPDEYQHQFDRINKKFGLKPTYPALLPRQPGKLLVPPPWWNNNNFPYNPINPNSPLNPNNPSNINNPNNPVNKDPFHPHKRLPGDASTNAPPPGGGKKKK